MASLVSALLSACASVYFEAVVKKVEANAPSLWVRNVQLCVFSVPLAALGVAYLWPKIQAAGGPLSGFDAYANSLVVLNAAGGLVGAVVVKYGDNVLKNFTTSCSVILGTLISVFLFDFHLTVQFAWGAALVMVSAYIYGRAAMQGGAASEDRANSASNCRAFLDCFSEAHPARGKVEDNIALISRGQAGETAEARQEIDSCDELVHSPKLLFLKPGKA